MRRQITGDDHPNQPAWQTIPPDLATCFRYFCGPDRYSGKRAAVSGSAVPAVTSDSVHHGIWLRLACRTVFLWGIDVQAGCEGSADFFTEGADDCDVFGAGDAVLVPVNVSRCAWAAGDIPDERPNGAGKISPGAGVRAGSAVGWSRGVVVQHRVGERSKSVRMVCQRRQVCQESACQGAQECQGLVCQGSGC